MELANLSILFSHYVYITKVRCDILSTHFDLMCAHYALVLLINLFFNFYNMFKIESNSVRARDLP